MRVCLQCNTDISTLHHNAQFCDKKCFNKLQNIKRNERVIKETDELFKNKLLDTDYVECKICGLKREDLSNHILKFHEISVDDYKKKFNVKYAKCINLVKKVQGENNPAYRHGGKYSPFSEKFLKYNDLDELQKIEIINIVKNKAYESLMAHPENRNNTLEFYVAKGHTIDEAKTLLADRQSTFSLKKCIEKFGEIDGNVLWQERQDKWQATLNDKSDDEKAEINRRKATNSSHIDSLYFYILLLKNDFVKIGITRYNINRRYNSMNRDMIKEEILFDENLPEVSFYIEQILKNDFSENKISKESQIGDFGYTETFKISHDKILEQYYSLKTLEIDKLKNKFDIIMENNKWN